MQPKEYIVLYPMCIPVKGAKRSIVCDLQNQNFQFIPNILYEILTKFHHSTVEELVTYYGKENEEHLRNYIQFLQDKHFIFFSTEPSVFKPLELNFNLPQTITNAVFDFSEHSNYPIQTALSDLSDLHCTALEFRFFYSPSTETLETIVCLTDTGTFRSISLVLKYSDEFTENWVRMFIQKHPRIQSILFHSTPETNTQISHHLVQYTSSVFASEACCGKVSPEHFISNPLFFTEAQTANSCLNKKVGIDQNGHIKNCPSMPQHFGSLYTDSIHEVVQKEAFSYLWEITKDQIETCKICEFRYICTDCRAYRRTESLHSKPKKCSYNPETAQW